MDRKKIVKGVVGMLKVNMGLKDGEKLLLVTDVPTLEEWKTKRTQSLTGAMRRSVLAKV